MNSARNASFKQDYCVGLLARQSARAASLTLRPQLSWTPQLSAQTILHQNLRLKFSFDKWGSWRSLEAIRRRTVMNVK